MSRILNMAETPPVVVGPDATVLQAVEEMDRKKVGAVAILRDKKLAGIFTERDVMLRVVLKKLDPAKTPIGQVMTSEVRVIGKEMAPQEALALMVDRHIRHLPITSEDGVVLGMLSIRNLLQNEVDRLGEQLNSLESYIGADGPGG